MLEFIPVPGHEKRTPGRSVCCIVTRPGRERYLSKTIRGLKREPVDIYVWANGPMQRPEGADWFYSHPFNCGQHVAHNEMLERADAEGYDWHIRADDDCWMITKKWMKPLRMVQDVMRRDFGWTVVSPVIEGLDAPPPVKQKYEIKNRIVEHVPMLGGIFRLVPMSIMRDFRWDERQAMGYGDATQFGRFCEDAKIPMFRVQGVRASHGESTQRQNVNAAWKIQHDMDQFIPLGL